jgi:hypothetical protein
MDTEIYAEIVVDCHTRDLDELTKITSLSPNKKHCRGDITKRGIELDYSRWTYETQKIVASNTTEVTNILVKAFSVNFEEFKDFILNNHCEVSICIASHMAGEAIPTFELNCEIIKMAYMLGAIIYFDGF